MPELDDFVANDNKKKAKKNWHLRYCELYHLDDYRPAHCKKLLCVLCGKSYVYVWPMNWATSDLQCHFCGNYEGLTEK